jgi:hypothetical protein
MPRDRPILKRASFGGTLLLFLLAVLSTAMALFSLAGAGPVRVGAFAPPLMWWASFLIAYLILRRYERRVLALVESDWRRCPACFYDLRGLANTGTCPECATPYDTAALQARWQAVAADDARRLGHPATHTEPAAPAPTTPPTTDT